MGCAVTSQGGWWVVVGGCAVEIKAKRQTSEVRQASVDGRPLVAEAGGRCSACCRSPSWCTVEPCGVGAGVGRPQRRRAAPAMAGALAASRGGRGARLDGDAHSRLVAVVRVAFHLSCARTCWSPITVVRPPLGLPRGYVAHSKPSPEQAAARLDTSMALGRARGPDPAMQLTPR